MQASQTIKLKWLGTAGFHILFEGRELLLDPYLSRPAEATPAIRARAADFLGVSLILISHGHFDHAMDAAALARVSGARVCAPRKTCRILEKQGLDPAALSPNEETPSLEWNGVDIRIVPSRHIKIDTPLILRTLIRALRDGIFFQMLPLLKNYPLGSNSDFLFDFSGYRLLFSGSGGGDWSALARLEPHCYLLPFAGRSDVTDHYIRALRILRPETVVLQHFDDFFPSFSPETPVEEFRARLERELPAIRLIVPEAEEEFSLP